MTSATETDSTSADPTLHLLKYREAARHLWNSVLREDDSASTVPDGFLLDRGEAIQDELFAALVLRYTGDVVHPHAPGERRRRT